MKKHIVSTIEELFTLFGALIFGIWVVFELALAIGGQ